MTREETLAVMSVLKAAYPDYYRDMRKNDADAIVNLWAEMFSDEPAQIVALAVKSLIATGKYNPKIADVKEKIVKLKNANAMTEQEAWNLVSRAISNGIYGSQKEFDALPASVQRIVGSPMQLKEWAMMDSDTVQSVVASNFQRSYKIRAESDREYMALPSSVRNVVDKLAAGMSMPALEEGTVLE